MRQGLGQTLYDTELNKAYRGKTLLLAEEFTDIIWNWFVKEEIAIATPTSCWAKKKPKVS